MWKIIWKENGLVVEFGSRRKLLAGGRCGTKAAAGGGVPAFVPAFAAFSPKNGGTSFQVWNSVQLWGADSNKTEKMRSSPRVQGSWRRGNMGRLLARTLFGLLWVGWSYAQDGPLVSLGAINLQLQRSTYFAILCKICRQIVCLHHTLIKMGNA